LGKTPNPIKSGRNGRGENLLVGKRLDPGPSVLVECGLPSGGIGNNLERFGLMTYPFRPRYLKLH
jgi:hypothetical protein